MPQIEVNLTQIEKLIEQLNERDKVKLVQRLEARTLPARWKKFLREIDKRRKKHPVSQKEIEWIVENTRQEMHERSHG